MKKFLMMCFAVAAMFMLAGCKDSPTDVTKKWISALIDGDVETANKYSTENAQVLNALFIASAKENEKVVTNMKNIQEKLGSAVEEINGDDAKVYPGGDKKGEAITLKKVDGAWKIDVKK